MWEVISAISGAISAICDIRGAGVRTVSPEASPATENRTRLAPRKLRALLVRSIAWCLAVFSFVCIRQPYGAFITDREYQELLGWIVAGPTVLVILAGLELSDRSTDRPSSS